MKTLLPTTMLMRLHRWLRRLEEGREWRKGRERSGGRGGREGKGVEEGENWNGVCYSDVQAKLLADGGLRPQDICVLAYYSKQVHRMRTVLRGHKLGQVRSK